MNELIKRMKDDIEFDMRRLEEGVEGIQRNLREFDFAWVARKCVELEAIKMKIAEARRVIREMEG